MRGTVTSHRHQDETIEDLPEDGAALLSLACGFRRRANEAFLLSATVDVAAEDQLAEADAKLTQRTLSNDHFLFFRRYRMSAKDGLSWFRSCQAGRARLPPEERPNTITLQPLLAEPPWPGLQCPVRTRTPASCLNEVPCRSAILIPTDPCWVEARLSPEELTAAHAELWDLLDFDFGVDEEFLGAAHLVVADPKLISVDVKRSSSPGERPFRISVTAQFRGGDEEGYTIVFHRHRTLGEETAVVLPLLAGTQEVQLPHKPHLHSYDIVHAVRGLVYRFDNADFLDGFAFEAGMVTRHRTVDVPADGKRDKESYTVPLVRDPVVGSSGPQVEATAAQILVKAKHRKEQRRPPFQRWFDGDADAAASIIRELIGSTRRRIMIVDPYFDHVELRRFALRVGRTAVPIRILTGAEGLRVNAKKYGKPAGDLLLADARAAQQGTAAQGVLEVRVMERAGIHDRFLAVDEHVWLLGSSLNQFGSRGTMLVALPAPADVLPHLEAAWDGSKTLDAWVRDRTVS
ncbi:MAG: hypothetical protein KC766_02535 [Myxococcales bacterium]|nr:hypothetical protein [Myxococcales bacterium]